MEKPSKHSGKSFARHLCTVSTIFEIESSFFKKETWCFLLFKMSVDPYGPASQTLTFLDTDEADFGADTQGSAYEFTDFTVPSQTQTQSQASQPVNENHQSLPNDKEEEPKEKLTNGEEVLDTEQKGDEVTNVAKSLGELNFEEEEDETYYSKDLPSHACR